MKLQKYLNFEMHDRNIFKNGIDFSFLRDKYPVLQRFVIESSKNGRFHFPFSNMEALRELTRILFLEYFNLKFKILDNRLIPRIPMRLNYIHWMEDVINIQETSINTECCIGVDIGCGPYCVFSSLLYHFHPSWHYVCSETDEESFNAAKIHIDDNNLSEHIELVKIDSHDSKILLPLFNIIKGCKYLENTKLIFTTCNPPFFENNLLDSSQRNRKSKHNSSSHKSVSFIKQNKHSAQVEIVCQEGECSFVCRIVSESLEILKDPFWKNYKIVFSSMLGKKSSLKEIVKFIKTQNQNVNIMKGVFIQGKVHRWGISWYLNNQL